MSRSTAPGAPLGENLVLAGFMGAGKTAVGRELARILDWRFVDIDTVIETAAGQSIAEIFRAHGEAEFRHRETQAIAALVGAIHTVVATGGGGVTSPANRAVLHNLGPIVHLDVPVDRLWNRVNGTERPLATDRAAFEALFRRRQPVYRSLPYQIRAGRGDASSIAKTIAERFVADGRRIEVSLGERSYAIEIRPGALCGLGPALADVRKPGRCLIVSHPILWRRYGELVSASLEAARWTMTLALVPPGESSKSLARANALYRTLISSGLERHDPIVAVGGGVVGDLAGFVAATYLRGVPFVQVPTTLLAQIDSSVGGKVAVNLPEGKNLVGAFHQPRLVVADPLVLLSLPEREFRSGLAELIKYGVILDAELFAAIERDLEAILDRRPSVLVPLIARACELKAQVVEADEREAGLRQILNFGHTLGHAVEKVAGYGTILHGEAVAIGMVFAARLAAEQDLCEPQLADRLVALLARAALPISTDLPADLLWMAMQHDKKVSDGRLTWILPERLGAVRAVGGIPATRVRSLVELRGFREH